ncbi:hypothetical protein HELRODRAFT_194133 [Helobdella robusta]|uniref:Arginine-glutamic acid dipeptide repeats protein n=1 Tax=Helobdella robusta TaxID=6412 RepID=T1FVQ5_HELRO|nr:hypothetical protein HELRODRAFT_194133 [Helobdella robusta]ESN93325.1 hypothetical protein HELRODRAFT_194133 [Helobdella robusta]
MATAPAQIQVGSNHQAKLPALIGEIKSEERNEHLETLVWYPNCIMDGDLLMYLRAARSMAAFVGWCDGGSTDDGCAAASMDETTINSLHMLHQHNYDTGKALQALVKIINPKSVDKRWSDEDAKKFVRGLKQHGKNFFKIRKDLLPYKDTPSLVEYYYLWKKTPAASTTRPHRRHRRPAFRRQAPTPTLPQEDDLDDMSSASEASEMESDEEINQSSLIATTSAANHSTSSCSRCSVTKSNRWYEINKDNVICSECHLNDKVMIGQTDDDAPATCDPIGPEDDAGHSAMDDDAPPFMFRPVKEDSEFGSDVKKKELEGSQDGKVGLMSGSLPVKTELTSSSAYDGYIASSLASSAYSSAASTASSGIVKYETPGDMLPASVHQSTCCAADDEATKDMVMSSSSSSSMLLPSSATVKYEVPCISTSMTSSSSSSSMMFSDFKPQRAVASVAPTFQDGVSTAGQHYQSSFQPPSTSLSSSSQLISSSSSSSSSLSSSSFTQMSSSQSSSPSVSSSSSALTNHYKSPFTSQSHHVMNMQGRPPPPPQSSTSSSSSSSSSPSNSTPMLQQPSYSSLAYPVPYSFSMPPPSSSSSFISSSSTNNMPEDMSIKSCKETTTNNNSSYNNNYNTSSHNNNNYSDNRNASNNSNNNMFTHSKQQQKHSQQQPHQHQQPQQQEPICHNISDDDDDENDDGGADVDCNVARSPSPPAVPASEQVYSSANSIFIRRWNRGGNMCSRSDLEFLPQKNSKWMMKKEERLLNKSSSSSSSSSSSGHHHHGHQSHHKSSSSSHHHQSSAKEGRRNEGRKDDDKTKSPMQNNNNSRSSDAQITSSYAGSSHHLPPFAGSSSDRMSQRSGTGANAAASGMFHDPTPALSQLSAYARPHIGNQRLMNYPPSHSIQDYFRLPGIFPPGSREVMELDMDKHAWERDVRERELREMEFMEKLKQELELKSAAAAGFDRLPHLPGASLDPIWIDMQRRLMASQLPLPSGAPPPSHLSGMFPPPGILSADLMQRERLEQIARSSQEQMAREGALLQLYQRYAHDPNMLQRQVSAYMASKAQESVHLVYHFAKADPLASAVSQSSSSSSNLPSSHLPPPPPLPSALHNLPPNHPLYAFARDPERMYMELLSRPPYNADPLLAQQVMSNLTAQAAAAAQQEALQRHLAMERDFPGNPMMH